MCVCIITVSLIFDSPWLTCAFSFLLKGLLAKPTHGNIIRFAPPLVINDSEVCLMFKFNIHSIFSVGPYSQSYLLVSSHTFSTQMDQALEILKKSLQPL